MLYLMKMEAWRIMDKMIKMMWWNCSIRRKFKEVKLMLNNNLKMTVMIRIIVYLKRLMRLKRAMRYLVLLRIPARVHQTPQEMMSLLMKKNMPISSTSLLQDQDGSIFHHILLIILFLLWILEFILDQKQEMWLHSQHSYHLLSPRMWNKH